MNPGERDEARAEARAARTQPGVLRDTWLGVHDSGPPGAAALACEHGPGLLAPLRRRSKTGFVFDVLSNCL